MTPLESLEAEVKRLREAAELIVDTLEGHFCFCEPNAALKADFLRLGAALQPRTAEETKERTWTREEVYEAGLRLLERQGIGLSSEYAGEWLPDIMDALTAAPRLDEGETKRCWICERGLTHVASRCPTGISNQDSRYEVDGGEGVTAVTELPPPPPGVTRRAGGVPAPEFGCPVCGSFDHSSHEPGHP